MFGIFSKIFASKNERDIRKCYPLVSKINEIESRLKKLSDAELCAQTVDFRSRLDAGESLEDILPEAFAVVREASIRVLGLRHFDVQMLGGIVLHQGKIAEMKTGEGKTLCATLPVYLNALSGNGVHVVTVNDYLAKRDAEWMGGIYKFLGLSVGVIHTGLDPNDRRQAYGSDITYGQNNEFGFDYLRDNMKLDLAEKAQAKHNYAIVDEVDSILIDEARTPLIISGPSEKATDAYRIANEVVLKLKNEQDYAIDLKSKQTSLTEEGVSRVEEILKLDNLYDPANIELVHHIQQAVKAHATMKRDVDYVVRDGQVIIVDEFTGRLMPGRRWSDGLHQAVEAKEHVKVQRENQTLATITFQNYFRMYKKLAGMTGTADTEAVEFKKIYNLETVIIPTNEPMIREDHPDVVFSTERGKFKSVCEEIKTLYEKGQPVLVGTASIEKSEMLSSLLQKIKIPHHVLNAKQHEREAEIVAQAGRFNAVTISTNMAGRGTDIVLGGNADALVHAELSGQEDEADYEEKFKERRKYYQALCSEERDKVLEAGGLHILGTERHESRRIDNQLRGRSGRQGDPGSSRFYVSLEDDLMKRFGGERIQMIMSRVGLGDEDAIEGALVARAIENAQKKVEGHHFDIRKHLLDYDDVMNKQREVIYSLREQILKGEDILDRLDTVVGNVCEDIVISRIKDQKDSENWEVQNMFDEFKNLFAVSILSESYIDKQKHGDVGIAQEIFDLFISEAKKRFEERRAHFGEQRMEKLAQIVHLQAIDYFWKEHLSNMDHLKEGIGLRGYAQKNPLFEYQREAFELFNAMMFNVEVSVVQNIFIPELPSEAELKAIEEKEHELQKQREAAAKEIHEAVLEGGGEKGSEQKGNREQRRRQSAVADSLVEFANLSFSEKIKKEAAKKKMESVKKHKEKVSSS